jgi:REP element-mobilizing transposase RayT
MELSATLIRMEGMARRNRIHFDGAIYHVMNKGVEGRHIFLNDLDRLRFLKKMRELEKVAGAKILAYCLMGTHFHIAIKVGSRPLGWILQRLLTSYAMSFNVRYKRRGHLFESRCEVRLCLDEDYLRRVIQYIHMNPVKAGLVERPQDWPWSSCFGIEMEIPGDLDDFDPWEGEDPILLRAVPSQPLGLEHIAESVSMKEGVAIAEIRSASRRRPLVRAKRLVARSAAAAGHSLTSIARWLNTTQSSLTGYLAENTANTGRSDP